MPQAVLSLDVDLEPAFQPCVVGPIGDASAAKPTPIELRVRQAFANSPIHAHRQLQVEQSGELIYLFGRLESFYYKQMAQELVRSICCNVQLMNEIAVD